MKITSIQNQRIKNICALSSSNNRKKANLFNVEGEREISRCISAGYVFDSFYYCPELWSTSGNRENSLSGQELLHVMLEGKTPVYETSAQVFKKLSSRENPDGNFAIVQSKNHSDLANITLKDTLILLIIEKIEKPGNLGAIIRTAESTGTNGIILCDPIIDIYNPNVIRNSQGAVFSVPIVISDNESTQQFLSANKITPILTTPSAEKIYWDIPFPKKTAIVMGSEKDGLSDSWLKTNFTAVRIPMMGTSDSLNVSTATSLVLYEILRQKSQNTK